MKLRELTEHEFQRLGKEKRVGLKFNFDMERNSLERMNIPLLSKLFSLERRYKRWLNREARGLCANAYYGEYEERHKLNEAGRNGELPYFVYFYRL